MPNTTGPVGTFNRTVGVKRDMDEAVDILTPDDVPLQALLSTDTTIQTKVEWMEEALMPQAVTVDDASVSGAGTSGDPWVFDVTAGEGSELRVGDLLWKRGAASTVQYLVTAISTDAVSVTAFAGNSTAPADENVLEIVGQYRDEGADPPDPRSLERVEKYNLTQIFQEAVEATRTARKRGSGGGLWGQRDPYDHEVMKKFRELAIRFERLLIHGQRVVSSDAKKRSMGGLFYYISTNSASNTKANSGVALNTLLRSLYDTAGGGRYVLVASPAVKAAISANIDPTLRRNSYESRRGGYVVDVFMSDFGEVEIIPDRHMPTTKALALDVSRIDVVNFDPFFHELLAQTGDGDNGHIVGEKSLRVKDEKAHGILTLTDAS